MLKTISLRKLISLPKLKMKTNGRVYDKQWRMYFLCEEERLEFRNRIATAEKNIRMLVPSIDILGYKTYNEAYTALKAGRISAITSDDTILRHYALSDSSVKILPKRYSKEPYGIAFKKGDSTIKLKQNLDFAIKDLQQKNVIPRLRKKWEI